MSSEEFVVVVEFRTNSDNHDTARQLISAYVGNFLSLQPGFIESRLHEKQEGTGLLHYARWQKESDFRAFAEKARHHPDLPAIREFSPSADFFSTLARFGA